MAPEGFGSEQPPKKAALQKREKVVTIGIGLERQPSRASQMIYLEIAYAHKDEAKPFGARWDPKEKLWYFPGDVLPKELERFRPANAPTGPVEKIILEIPFSYRDVALKAGARCR